jgi:hypothetical protein
MNVKSDDSDFTLLKFAGTLTEQRGPGMAFIIVCVSTSVVLSTMAASAQS